jgi:hypothetical protein
MVPVAAPLDQNQRIASVSPSASLIFPVLPPTFKIFLYTVGTSYFDAQMSGIKI